MNIIGSVSWSIQSAVTVDRVVYLTEEARAYEPEQILNIVKTDIEAILAQFKRSCAFSVAVEMDGSRLEYSHTL